MDGWDGRDVEHRQRIQVARLPGCFAFIVSRGQGVVARGVVVALHPSLGQSSGPGRCEAGDLGTLECFKVGDAVPVALALLEKPFPGAEARRDNLKGTGVEDEDLGLRDSGCQRRGQDILEEFGLDDEERDLGGLDVVGDFVRLVCWVGATEDASGADPA